MDRETRVSVTDPEILRRLSSLHVVLSVEHGRIRAHMLKAGLPIPDEARGLILQVKPHVLSILDGEPVYKRPGQAGRCDWCRNYEAARKHQASVLACSECDVRI